MGVFKFVYRSKASKQLAKSLDFLLLFLPILLFVFMALPKMVFDLEYFSEH